MFSDIKNTLFVIICINIAYVITSYSIHYTKLYEDMYYPAVFGFWNKTETFTETLLRKDKVLRQKIEEYITRSKQMIGDIDFRIADVTSSYNFV